MSVKNNNNSEKCILNFSHTVKQNCLYNKCAIKQEFKKKDKVAK